MIDAQSFESRPNRGHEPRPKLACVVDCGGRDTTLGRVFNSRPPSSQYVYHEDQPIASPSPGGRASSERGERQLLCCSIVGEGELSVAEARGSNFSVLNPIGFIGDLLALRYNLSTFPSAKIKNQNLIIPQCSRASSGIPLKSDLSQIKLIARQKIPKFFPATFIGNHWQIRQKYSKKPCEITQKNARF